MSDLRTKLATIKAERERLKTERERLHAKFRELLQREAHLSAEQSKLELAVSLMEWDNEDVAQETAAPERQSDELPPLPRQEEAFSTPPSFRRLREPEPPVMDDDETEPIETEPIETVQIPGYRGRVTTVLKGQDKEVECRTCRRMVHVSQMCITAFPDHRDHCANCCPNLASSSTAPTGTTPQPVVRPATTKPLPQRMSKKLKETLTAWPCKTCKQMKHKEDYYEGKRDCKECFKKKKLQPTDESSTNDPK